MEEILELQQIELEAKQEKERIRHKAMQEVGLTSNYEAIHEEF